MKTVRHSLRKIVTFINDRDEDGGFWLPNIQRPFVWDEEQICRLFDSVMRCYPISTMLIWKTKAPLRMRKFIDHYTDGIGLSALFQIPDEKKKCLVLDGQQRLQSMFIGLRGSFNKKELFLNVLSGKRVEPDDVKFEFRFLPTKNAIFPWVKVRDIVYSQRPPLEEAEHIMNQATNPLAEKERILLSNNVSLVQKRFTDDETVSYQELDSTEHPDLYGEDDVVEVFIRANSGGTRLEKSDLMFALLVASWDEAGDKLEELSDELNQSGFGFTRDFLLKTCLSILGFGAVYSVERFRTPEVKRRIENNWHQISSAIRDVLDHVRGRTFVRSGEALLSYLALIPLVYARYHFPEKWQTVSGVSTYLVSTLLCRVFGGHSDLTVDACVAAIEENQGFDCEKVFEAIRKTNKPLQLHEERFFRIGYNSPEINLIFSLWYKDFDYQPSYSKNLPQIDHIFPQSLLRKRGIPKKEMDQLANCMLLRQEENGASQKSDCPPDKWFADKPDDYLELHLIPKDRALWHPDKFDSFVEARKELIKQRFGDLIATGTTDPNLQAILALLKSLK